MEVAGIASIGLGVMVANSVGIGSFFGIVLVLQLLGIIKIREAENRTIQRHRINFVIQSLSTNITSLV